MVKVLYFGVAQEIAGLATEEFYADDISDLRRQILERHPGIHSIVFRLSLNGSLITTERALKERDKIALLPPFAGG